MIFFLIFAPLFAPKSEMGGRGMTFFIGKKASFRLSVTVNLDNSRTFARISRIKLTY